MNKHNVKKIKNLLIFGRGQFPISSAGLRMRNWAFGLEKNGIKTKILIAYPAPSKEDVKLLKTNEFFILPPSNKNNTFIDLFNKIKGTISGYIYLKKNKEEIDAVLLYGIGFIEGLLVYIFCKKYKKIFIAERCDENRQKYLGRKLKFSELLAMYNDYFFDKFLLKKLNILFVVSSYLENKYRKLIKNSNTKIIRSSPVFINFEQFDKLRYEMTIEELAINVEPFKSGKLKIFYAGSANLLNGIFFFLECAANLITQKNYDFNIIFIIHSGNINLIKNYVNKLGISNKVFFLNKIPYEKLLILYNYVDILVLPEMGDVIADAGFPGKLGEYLASGKAIITTNFSDLSFYLKNKFNAMISDVGDKNLYIQNLEAVLTNSELRIQIGKNARKTAEKYFNVLDQTKRILNDINMVYEEL